MKVGDEEVGIISCGTNDACVNITVRTKFQVFSLFFFLFL